MIAHRRPKRPRKYDSPRQSPAASEVPNPPRRGNMAPAMFEPNDKKTKGGSRGGGGGPTPPESRRVVQPLSAVRGNRPVSNPLVPPQPTLGMDGVAAEGA